MTPPARRLLTLALALALTVVALAQSDGTAGGPVTTEQIRARLAALGEGDAAARDLYERALRELERAAESASRAADFRARAGEAPGLLESIRAELAQPADVAAPAPPADATLTRLEEDQAQAAAQLKASRDHVAELQAEAERRQARRSEIPGALAAARQRLEELDEAIAARPVESEPTATAEARRALLAAERRAAAAEVDALEAELANYDARRDLLPARLDRAKRRVAQNERRVAAWQEIVSGARRDEAERGAREAQRLRRDAARQHPALQAYAAESHRLAELRTQAEGVPQRISKATHRVSVARERLAELRAQYAAARRRIEASGFNRATGLLLRRQYESLPDIGALRRRVAETQRAIEDAEYRLIELQEARAEAGDTDRVVRSLLSEIDTPQESMADLEAAARDLAAARRDLLDRLVSDASQHMDVLLTLDALNRDLLEAAAAYESFIRERILWVRSIAGSRRPAAEDFERALGWMLDAEAWGAAARRVRDSVASRLPTTVLAGLLIAGAYTANRRSVRRINRNAERVSRFREDTLGRTFETLLHTAIASLPTPALLWTLGWVLTRPEEQVGVAAAVGAALRAAAWLVLPLLFLRHVVRPDGLAEAHFRWRRQALALVRRHLRWFVPAVAACVAVFVAADRSGDEAIAASVGRIAFTVYMLATAGFLRRLLRPSGAVLGEFLRQNSGGWIDRLRYLWYPAIVAVPVALIVLAWLGYYDTARQLETRLEQTILLLLALTLVNGLLMRWLFVARRKVAIEEFRRRREQLSEDGAGAGPPPQGAPPPAAEQEEQLDLPAISSQTRQLFRTALVLATALGLALIWSDVLPALRMLDRVQIYPSVRVIETAQQDVIPVLEPAGAAASEPVSPAPTTTGEVGPAGPPSPTTIPGMPAAAVPQDAGESPAEAEASAPFSLTLADVGLAIIVLVITVVAFRNLPGLIEIAVLQRLPLDASSRYALSTVLRYSISIFGVAIALGAIGLSWSKVQWLAAALTFGLAFGLQEIFANFVSGLIILGERPIRIGDTVTVGSVSGTVSKIRMRATTITDWDRKELIIPNKSFITGEVINWSLSDPIIRLTVPVGVSYGADVKKAEAILMRCAREAPNVLEDPPPFVTFGRFGESTLDFDLRVYLPQIDVLLPTRHDLHMRIIEAFREAGVEIAFPQRDLHVRSADGLRELIEKADGSAPAAGASSGG